MRSLQARVTAVTVLVAIVAVLVTGLLSLQLVSSSTTQQAREQLAAQADRLAGMPGPGGRHALAEQSGLGLEGAQIAVVGVDGAVDGDTASVVDDELMRLLNERRPLSDTRPGGRGMLLVEARPAGDGTSIVLSLPVSSLDQAIRESSIRIVIALGVGLVIAVIGGTLLARLLSRPLADTAAAARKLAAGQRGVAMPQSRTSEMSDVTDALSALDTALVTSEGRQREFLLSISHELRTPLTAVRGYAEAMADGLVTDVEAVGRTLVAETERLDHFVGDLLELARLEADDFSISARDVDLALLLADVAAAWSGRAALLGVTVTAGGQGVASTDARRLRQVIDGLVENAMRVTPAGASIELTATGSTIEVADAGPGLAPEDLAVAFERGVLRARYRDIRPVGTGLGLSIAARLVQRLGGTLSVENRPDGGAVFRVALG